MLKGNTKIELTDVNTGKKQVIKKHNLITNAVNEIFNMPFGIDNDYTTNNTVDISHNPETFKDLFGGIMLFDSEITENANTLFPSYTSNMIGCGAADSSIATSENKFMGSYNSNESEFNIANKMLKLVYDYTTSQANGTINSICLTDLFSGYGLYNANLIYSLSADKRVSKTIDRIKNISNIKDSTDNIAFNSNYEYLAAVDVDNEVLYSLVFVNSTNIILRTRRFSVKNIYLIDNSCVKIQDIPIVLPIGISTKCDYNYDRSDNCIYISTTGTTSDTIQPNSTFYTFKITLLGNVTQYSVINTTNVSLRIGGGSATVHAAYSLCHNGYIYLLSNNDHAYSIQLSNSSNYFDHGSIESSIHPRYGINGIVVWNNYASSGSRIYTTHQGFAGKKSSGRNQLGDRAYKAFIPVINHPMYYLITEFSNAACNFYRESGFFLTINNLPSPITKTNAQTMKITYTLQEVNDE